MLNVLMLLLFAASLALAFKPFLLTRVKVWEFQKLLMVPILKGDLNRILKVCATYNYPLSSAFHAMVLKIKRGPEMDLTFQEGVTRLYFLRDRTKFKAICSGVLSVLGACVAGAAFPALPAAQVVLAAGIILVPAYFHYEVYKNIGEQILALYNLRSILITNVYKVAEGDAGVTPCVPARFRPVPLSPEELTRYQQKMAEFNQYIAGRKQENPGQPVDIQAEWDAVDAPATPEDVQENGLSSKVESPY